jgi:hypothetical protein
VNPLVDKLPAAYRAPLRKLEGAGWTVDITVSDEPSYDGVERTLYSVFCTSGHWYEARLAFGVIVPQKGKSRLLAPMRFPAMGDPMKMKGKRDLFIWLDIASSH